MAEDSTQVEVIEQNRTWGDDEKFGLKGEQGWGEVEVLKSKQRLKVDEGVYTIVWKDTKQRISIAK